MSSEKGERPSTMSSTVSNSWSGQLLADLAGESREILLADGEALVDEGDLADEVFYLRSGTLVASISTADGVAPIALVEAGELIGEITVVVGGRRSATLRADGAAEVVAIGRAPFERWLDEHPEIAEDVVRTARQRVDRNQLSTMLLEWLGPVEPVVLQALVERIDWCSLEPGDVLFRQGDPSDAAYFVISGRLLVMMSEDATTAVTGESLAQELGRGEVVGEYGLLDRAPRSATVRAIRHTTLGRIRAATFDELGVQFPGLLLHIARGLVERIRRPTARLADRASTIAVAVLTDRAPDRLVPIIFDEIGRHGSAAHLSSDRVDTLLDRSGIAQDLDVQVPRLSEFLHEADLGHDHLLLEADRELTPWTRRALLQADRVVLVVAPEPSTGELERIDAMLRVIEQLDHVLRIVAIAHPADADLPTGTGALMDRLGATEVVHLRGASETEIRRLARLASGHGIGLVLGGGGARGFAHLGVLRALGEAGVPIDMIGGCSMGAMLGGVIALDMPDDEIEGFVESQCRRLLDYTLPLVSLLKGGRITRNLDRGFRERDIEDLWIPYYCVSTNLTTSQLELHRRGRAATFVRASLAIPGVLAPVPHDGCLLVDGGVLNNLPVTAMRRLSTIGTVIAVDVAPRRGPRAKAEFTGSVSGWRALGARIRPSGASYPALSTVLLRSMITGAVRTQQDALRGGTVDLLVEMELPGIGLLEFERTREVARLGYDAAMDQVIEWAGRTGWRSQASAEAG